jgi:transcriptional regulator GlxA family with amidase domain
MTATRSSKQRLSSEPREPRRMALFAFAGAQSLDIVGPLEVFAAANAIATRGAANERGGLARSASSGPNDLPYRVEVLASRAGPLAMKSGLRLCADRSYHSVSGRLDTLLVAGGDEEAVRGAMTGKFLRWLRRVSWSSSSSARAGNRNSAPC